MKATSHLPGERATLPHVLLRGFLPARCMACDDLLWEQRDLLCPACAATLVAIGEDACPRCGRPRPGLGRVANRLPCGPCRERPPAFHEATAAYEFGGALADAVRRFKYRPTPALATPLARLAAGRTAPVADLVVPVPLFRRRLRRRGFNQSLLLARAWGRLWDIGVCCDALRRTRDTAPQTLQPTAHARARNVDDAFRVRRPERVAGKRVLLVDDVLTTGATAGACARALRAAGAAHVAVRTIARG